MSKVFGEYKNEYQDIIFLETNNKNDIYTGYNKQDRRDVSLKIIDKEKSKDNNLLRDELNKQKEIINAYKSDNILDIYRLLETESTFILEQEFYETNMHEYILENGPLNTNKNFFKQIAIELAKAVKILYDNKIIHRRIKSSSLFLKDKNGKYKIKLGNFDKAIFIKDNISEPLDNYYYTAPEIINGDKYDEKSDLWSFGITLYDIYFGDLPYGYKPSKIKIIKALSTQDNFHYEKSGFPLLDIIFDGLLKINPKERIPYFTLFDIIFEYDFMDKNAKYEKRNPSILRENENAINKSENEKKDPLILIENKNQEIYNQINSNSILFGNKKKENINPKEINKGSNKEFNNKNEINKKLVESKPKEFNNKESINHKKKMNFEEELLNKRKKGVKVGNKLNPQNEKIIPENILINYEQKEEEKRKKSSNYNNVNKGKKTNKPENKKESKEKEIEIKKETYKNLKKKQLVKESVKSKGNSAKARGINEHQNIKKPMSSQKIIIKNNNNSYIQSNYNVIKNNNNSYIPSNYNVIKNNNNTHIPLNYNVAKNNNTYIPLNYNVAKNNNTYIPLNYNVSKNNNNTYIPFNYNVAKNNNNAYIPLNSKVGKNNNNTYIPLNYNAIKNNNNTCIPLNHNVIKNNNINYKSCNSKILHNQKIFQSKELKNVYPFQFKEITYNDIKPIDNKNNKIINISNKQNYIINMNKNKITTKDFRTNYIYKDKKLSNKIKANAILNIKYYQ